MIALTRDKIDRLVFARYLLKQAEIQKEKGRPFSSTTILLLHDLVECFLQIALEVHLPRDKKGRNDILDTVVEKLNEKLNEMGYPSIARGYIKKLNELRNQLKHSTIFIDEVEINNLFNDTSNFISSYSSFFFDKDISELSIIELIKNAKIKEHLTQAEKAIEIPDLENAIVNIAKGYLELEAEELVFNDIYGTTALRSERKPNYRLRSNIRSITVGGSSKSPDDHRDTFNEIEKDFSKVYRKIFEIEKAMVYGLDYLSFLRFKSYLPEIRASYSREKQLEYTVPSIGFLREKRYTIETVSFCKDFLTEMVLKMGA